jgi:outer membrane autotransporter protein
MVPTSSWRSFRANFRSTPLSTVSRLAICAAVGSSVLFGPVAAVAHTDSLGFIITDGSADDLFNFQIFYGSWHSGVGLPEGALDLSKGGAIIATETFQIFPGFDGVADGTVPPGLVAGTNYFFPDTTTIEQGDLTGDPTGHGIYAFQYVTFTDMAAGDYTFGYNAGSSFTANWQPSDSAINAGSFKINANGSLGGVGGAPSTSFETGDTYNEDDLSDGTVLPQFDGGTLALDNPTTLTTDFTINDAGGNIDTQGNDATASGAFSGTGGLTKTGEGTLTLTGTNSYGGGTTIDGGTLVANTGTLPGDVTNNSVLVLDQTTAGTFSGVISGSGALTKTGNGTLTLTGANSYTGGTTIETGTLVASPGTLSGSVVNNSVLVLNQTQDGAFNGAISGSGTVKKTGGGTLHIGSGDDFTVSSLEIEDGSAVLSTNIAGTAVGVRGTLAGNGTLGGLIVHTSGTAAPGGNAASLGTSGIRTSGGRIGTVAQASSIGKLTSATYVVFEAGSHYDVEVDAAGHTDKVEATGTATLEGGTVHVLAQNGDYAPSTSYEILSAAGGLTGEFAAVDSNLAFLVPVLDYDGDSVTLTLLRNDLSFADVAATPNQKAAGAAADEVFDFGSAAYTSLMGATADETRTAFDSFSGEVHATALASVAQSTAGLRRALLARGARLSTAEGEGVSLWVQGLGEWGSLEGNGNAADVDNTTYGMLVGTEIQASDSLRFGLLTGYSEMDVVVGARRSKASIEGNHFGAYASYAIGGLNLRGGGTYTALRFDTERAAAVRGFAEQLRARYDGNARQVFAEAAYRVWQGRGHVEPFAGLDAVWVSKDGFTERGGSMALTDAGNNEDYTWSTLGLRAAVPAVTSVPITLQGSAAWQHALGGTSAEAVMSFDGGTAFTVAGAPLEKDSLVIGAGIEWRLTPNVALGANYAGALSDRRTDQSVKFSLSLAL